MSNATKPSLVKVKVEAGEYQLTTRDPDSPFYGRVIATVVRTGTPGRDDYPWDWYLADGLWFDFSGKCSGVADTLTNAVGVIEARVKHYGLVEDED